MPLVPGYSREVISRNIAELRREGTSRKQAVKIAYDHARQIGGAQVKEPRKR